VNFSMISLNVNIHKSVKIAAPAGFFPLCLVIDTHTHIHKCVHISDLFMGTFRVCCSGLWTLFSGCICMCVCVLSEILLCRQAKIKFTQCETCPIYRKKRDNTRRAENKPSRIQWNWTGTSLLSSDLLTSLFLYLSQSVWAVIEKRCKGSSSDNNNKELSEWGRKTTATTTWLQNTLNDKLLGNLT